MKPTVGVLPLWDEAKDSIWMLPGYMDGILTAGAVPLILPFSTDEEDIEKMISTCDGFLFTGGPDISPAVYGEEPIEGLNDICQKRDELEIALLKAALEYGKPVLGICRGIQLINAALGGTLYQDLPTQHPSDVIHRQQPPYDVPSHTVSVLKDSPLYEYIRTETADVNSSHHQAIKPSLRSLPQWHFPPTDLPKRFTDRKADFSGRFSGTPRDCLKKASITKRFSEHSSTRCEIN